MRLRLQMVLASSALVFTAFAVPGFAQPAPVTIYPEDFSPEVYVGDIDQHAAALFDTLWSLDYERSLGAAAVDETLALLGDTYREGFEKGLAASGVDPATLQAVLAEAAQRSYPGAEREIADEVAARLLQPIEAGFEVGGIDMGRVRAEIGGIMGNGKVPGPDEPVVVIAPGGGMSSSGQPSGVGMAVPAASSGFDIPPPYPIISSSSPIEARYGRLQMWRGYSEPGDAGPDSFGAPFHVEAGVSRVRVAAPIAGSYYLYVGAVLGRARSSALVRLIVAENGGQVCSSGPVEAWMVAELAGVDWMEGEFPYLACEFDRAPGSDSTYDVLISLSVSAHTILNGYASARAELAADHLEVRYLAR